MPARGIISAMSLDSVSSQQSAPAYRPTATVQAIGSRWGVAAGHALAAEAAAHVLGAGGNAVDAGVAAGICLGVVHCDMVSVAGVAPILVHLARTGETFQVSGVGPYPRASTLEYFRGLGNQIPPGLPRTVVPAAPAAWCAALERWGTMSFADVARAATEHAGRGSRLRSSSASQMAATAEKYRRWPTSTALYLNNGRPFRMGERLVQAELAETLSRMARAEAREGGSRAAGVRAARDEFYRGETAARIAEFHRAEKGPLTAEDLASFEVEVERAIVGTYGPWQVGVCGFWCQGPVLLQMLNLIEGTDVAALHAEGNGFSATPSDPNVDSPAVAGVGCVVSPRGSQGWLDPAHTSVVAPGKRPRLTPAPAMLLRDGRLVMPFGTPGGDVQQQAMLQVLLNHVVFDMPLQQAIEAPRAASRSFPDSFCPPALGPGKLEVERRVPKETRDALAARGHEISEWPEWEWRAGAVCGVRIAQDGARWTGADPRRGAHAIAR